MGIPEQVAVAMMHALVQGDDAPGNGRDLARRFLGKHPGDRLALLAFLYAVLDEVETGR